MIDYDWPGNVRALRHAIERAVILTKNEYLEPEDLQARFEEEPKQGERARAWLVKKLEKNGEPIPASIDEGYLDFSGCEGMYHQVGDSDADATIERVARAIRQRVQDELGLPASIGIGSTRPVAKMASAVARSAGP